MVEVLSLNLFFVFKFNNLGFYLLAIEGVSRKRHRYSKKLGKVKKVGKKKENYRGTKRMKV